MTRLTPADMPRPTQLPSIQDAELPPEVITEMLNSLAKLREQFPPDMIEKLPKPIRKGAWEGGRSQRCHICHGYHVIEDSIHLDYVGHANTTNRILDVDPFWEWEPLAYTEAGLPLFDKVGGLWIKLTICGVTRLGYGDGPNPKEIIGDAIRNAAMRFGVALDLWSKIDLHAERNPGDGQTQTQRPSRQRDEVSSGGSGDSQPAGGPVADAAPNQDALDSLGSVCDENGYDRRTMRDEYAKWATSKRYKNRDLLVAEPDRILAFAAKLIEDATVEPDTSDEAQAGPGAEPGGDEPGGDGQGVAQAGGREPADTAAAEADSAMADPLDTSDVEKQDGQAF